LKIANILFNQCRTNQEIDQFLADQNLSKIRDLVSHTFIPKDAAVNKAIDKKIPLALCDVKSPASSAYLKFAKELISVFK
jgi:chromosome partitioning protein